MMRLTWLVIAIMIAGYTVDASALTTADVPVVAMARGQHRCVA
jgi:hypothetical protein